MITRNHHKYSAKRNAKISYCEMFKSHARDALRLKVVLNIQISFNSERHPVDRVKIIGKRNKRPNGFPNKFILLGCISISRIIMMYTTEIIIPPVAFLNSDVKNMANAV